MTIVIKTLLLVVFLTYLLTAGNKRELISPNKNARAVVYNFVEKDIPAESRVRILDHKGRALLDTNFNSPDHEHGFGVIQAQWTADSQFFVFGMGSSGGHMPWQVFTFVFSLATNELISINKSIVPITSLFKLFPPDSLDASSLGEKGDESKHFGLRLSTLIHKQ